VRLAALGLTAGVGLLTALSGCGGGTEPGSDGDRLPAVQVVQMESGETVSLDSIAGPAVVNLWYSTCVPCLKEMPDFEAVHQARQGEIEFVGVNIGEDAERAAAFAAQVGVTYRQYLDQLGYVSSELEVTSMPTTLLIDAGGVITVRHSGAMSQGELNEAIDATLAG
jgi:thiol-disulfide isomerase/thioredoxin